MLEQNSVEDVDTRVRAAPLPDTRQDVLGAMTNLHGAPPAIPAEIPEAIDVMWLATTGSAATVQCSALASDPAWMEVGANVNVSAIRF